MGYGVWGIEIRIGSCHKFGIGFLCFWMFWIQNEICNLRFRLLVLCRILRGILLILLLLIGGVAIPLRDLARLPRAMAGMRIFPCLWGQLREDAFVASSAVLFLLLLRQAENLSILHFPFRPEHSPQ